MKRMWIVLALILSILPMGVQAAASEEVTPLIQKAIQYYYHHGAAATAEIADTVADIKALDADQGELWEGIMADWAWCNDQMEIIPDVLPDGLPEDDSLCIVILGFSLNDDGSLADELIARLTVGLASAQKYPNAYVAVTGGGTAKDPNVTEAGQMAAWLQENGIDNNRIIVEDKSLSTNENAVNTYRILRDDYPTVTSLAVVSSDYHVARGCAMFKTMCHYVTFNGGRAIEVVANAANTTENGKDEDMFAQAWGVSVITHTPFDTENTTAPALYWVEETKEKELEPIWINKPTEAPAVESEEESAFSFQIWMLAPVVLLVLVLLLIQWKTKQRKKRRRRENPVWKARENEKK